MQPAFQTGLRAANPRQGKARQGKVKSAADGSCNFQEVSNCISTVLGKKGDFKKHLLVLKCRSVYLSVTATKLRDLLG